MAIKKLKSSKRAAPKSGIRSLQRANRKLREAIADVWNILNEVDEGSSSDDMYAAIDSVCDGLITAFPSDYKYDDPTESTTEPEAASEAMAVAVARARGRIATELGITEEELAKGRDLNEVLPAWRKVYADEMNLTDVPTGGVSAADYKAIVAAQFINCMLLTADVPTTLKGEAVRYSEAMREINKTIPKRKRTPAKYVELAALLRAEGKSFDDIAPQVLSVENGYEKNWSDLTHVEKRKARRALRHSTESLLATRRSRAQKKENSNTSSK